MIDQRARHNTRAVSVTDERVRHNVRAVATWTADDWTRWLYKSLREKDYRPLRFYPRASVISQVEEVYVNAGEDMRHAMTIGLVQALRIWEEDFHGLEILQDLAWIAARIRALYAVPVLLKILIDNRRAMRWGHPFFDPADTILGVLAGFAVDEHDKRLEAAFDGLFYDDDVAPHFSALLALGITICNPARFAETFTRFVDQHDKIKEHYFVSKDIVLQFAEHMTNKRFTDSLDLLKGSAKRYALVAAVLAEIVPAHAIMGIDPDMVADEKNEQISAPIPFTAPPAEDRPENDAETGGELILYENARDRFAAAVMLYRGRHKSILETASIRIRQRSAARSRS